MMSQKNFGQPIQEYVQKIEEQILKEKYDLDEAMQLFIDAPVYTVEKNGGSVEKYQYFLYPFKGSTLTNFALYKKVSDYLAKMVSDDTEVIVTIEADGIPVASYIGAERSLPVIISKSFHYHVPSVEFEQKTGYYKRTMYLPKEIEGKKVAIVDCMVSTGQTIRGLIDAIKTLPNTKITGVFCVNHKPNYTEKLEDIAQYGYKYIFDTHVNDNGIVEAGFSRHLKEVFWEQIDQQFFELAETYAQLSNISKNGYAVGALIVAADTFEIVAHGYRRGDIHAEHDAINMLKSNCPDWESRDFTLYSTLEPCTYRKTKGYTPCCELIEELPQIRWVVVGRKDKEDEVIYGKGVERLKEKKHIRLLEDQTVLKCPNVVPHFSSKKMFS
ncbi:hypothetical protein KKG22_02180 [Patescibacteria group bacterium]|nr:hypothetical protein [Patescibacteria group bacterium]MBU1721839.1 hypothetical protein [Patescibacteria group bacterium]MBU1901666.1 hypothetical protein [Patescibacteria group bacterium]